MGEVQHDIQKLFREQKEKYAYYIIALCVAAIAFSVQQTKDVSLKLEQIPLALAIISWAVSIYCGLKCIRLSTRLLFDNNEYLDLVEGRSKLAGTHPEKIEIGRKILLEVMEEKGKKGGRYSSMQNNAFYIGSILFLFWHVLEMYFKKV